ncbi:MULTISPECIES: PadR family transcriptional regulator [unclassified Parafrankia]|uniref:PadR family transcriptional regulator n=1 Tax=unclassified Parafrankia TaxID=2994368 RepID=UPI000DA4B554|nr:MULTISPECIES: PadR family transcriptional regulator [unclassified Parafrankia]TCJ40546.1 PadR family transcriptional regulator [Parafrankia sp. BMG5.11]CAI7974765.1 PadR family transcriptional regulator, regulatory protein AphA [Frankia sp. Hr75.2]SQD95202.1 Transcriptional regulator, PadR-like family [Parafrankia sp. Ea1.12]
MSIRNGLLALLAERPMYGYQLRAEFESRTGSTWPLNIGQVYTTLRRLERDGLVEGAEDPGPQAPAGGEGRGIVYRLSASGHAAARRWWTTPVSRRTVGRDELAIKLALAVTVPGVDVGGLVLRQRTETLRAMQEHTRLRRQADETGDVAWLLVLDSLVFAAEAEIRWLDHVESRLARAAVTRTRTDAAAPGGASAGGASGGERPGAVTEARR